MLSTARCSGRGSDVDANASGLKYNGSFGGRMRDCRFRVWCVANLAKNSVGPLQCKGEGAPSHATAWSPSCLHSEGARPNVRFRDSLNVSARFPPGREECGVSARRRETIFSTVRFVNEAIPQRAFYHSSRHPQKCSRSNTQRGRHCIQSGHVMPHRQCFAVCKASGFDKLGSLLDGKAHPRANQTWMPAGRPKCRLWPTLVFETSLEGVAAEGGCFRRKASSLCPKRPPQIVQYNRSGVLPIV